MPENGNGSGRLARLETQVDRTTADVNEIKSDIGDIVKLLVKLETQNGFFIKLFWGALGVLMSGVGGMFIWLIQGAGK